jgi:hypothetical protein
MLSADDKKKAAAEAALEYINSGDIVGVTVSLGVAFNSTFVALVVSILLMFLLHQLQLLQDRLVLDAQNYCNENLVRYLQVPQMDHQT